MGKFTIIFLIVGIVVFQFFAEDLFPGGGINRTIAAGFVGAVCVLVGSFVDKKIKDNHDS